MIISLTVALTQTNTQTGITENNTTLGALVVMITGSLSENKNITGRLKRVDSSHGDEVRMSEETIISCSDGDTRACRR